VMKQYLLLCCFIVTLLFFFFFFSSRRRHTRWPRDWSSDVCSSDLPPESKTQTISFRRGPAHPNPRHDKRCSARFAPNDNAPNRSRWISSFARSLAEGKKGSAASSSWPAGRQT